jgi:sugar lactone lactonase YvrE
VPSIPVHIALEAGDQLGEGPVWDSRSERLVRVDISNGLVHRWVPGGAGEATSYDGPTSAVVLRDGAGWVVAVGRRLVLDAPGGRAVLAEVEPDRPHNRFNDCRADPQGRLWAGTMSTRREAGVAALYRLEPGGEIERVIGGTTISNGIGWSPDGETMYFVDSTTQRVDAFSFDGATGAISERRSFAAIDPDDGLPDGLQVDAEGGVWLALFGGAAVRRYAPGGELDAHVELPDTNPTCPGFGGPDLTTLYVTSAKHKLSPEALAAEPLAGALLALEPGVRGQAPGRFAG